MNLQGITFEKLLDQEEISEQIKRLARRINVEYKGKDPLFLVILNGAFMFASDLMKEIRINARISFIKLSSYESMESTGEVLELIGLNEDLSGQDIIILEDIIDSGTTVRKLLTELKASGAASVKLASVLTKKKTVPFEFPIDYLAFEIENEFVVGYGMDIDGLGRNLKDIYVRVAD